MQTDPKLQLSVLSDCLLQRYEIKAENITFLPLGFDAHTVSYKAISQESQEYFLKIRTGNFLETSATIPDFLQAHGIDHVIAPVKDRDGKVWNRCGDLSIILFPFLKGVDAWNGGLSLDRKTELGKMLKAMHSLVIPDQIKSQIPVAKFENDWCEKLENLLTELDAYSGADNYILTLKQFVNANTGRIGELLSSYRLIAKKIKPDPSDFVLCHADAHAGNIFVAETGEFYLVDWDTIMLAPKERDLMYIGSGVDSLWKTPEDLAAFYSGYGAGPVDQDLLSYYRQIRIIEDLAVIAKDMWNSVDFDADRKNMLEFFQANFLPGNTIDIALKQK